MSAAVEPRTTVGVLARLRAAIPTGSTLPEAEFRRRHRVLLTVLWLHVPALTLFGFAQGYGVVHSLFEGGIVAIPAAAAQWLFPERKQASALVAFGLISSSAVTVHISGGFIEAHFHFFVMIVALTLYEDWLAFGVAAAYVLIHHGVIGTITPASVYNHAGAIAHPWRWAGIHAGFVAAAGLFAVVAWRLSEDARQAQQEALAATRQAEADARRAEADARRAAEELERSNRDLEQFAYVASHDLSEPLRTVSSFMGLIQRRYQGKLDADADQWIDFAVDGSRRMHTLIDDLLHFSRAGRGDLVSARVDLGEVVEEVRAALDQAFTDAGATLYVEHLPAVLGDHGQIGLVLQNLIANATKFRGEAPPVVTVTGAPEQPGWVRICVADNGIGIDAEHRDEVFAMFTRLHAATAYSGTGVGLAICQRIVEHHGGRIWVEEADGGGAKFCFTLPAA